MFFRADLKRFDILFIEEKFIFIIFFQRLMLLIRINTTFLYLNFPNQLLKIQT